MLFSRHPPTDLRDTLFYCEHASDFLDEVVTTGVRKDFSCNDRNRRVAVVGAVKRMEQQPVITCEPLHQEHPTWFSTSVFARTVKR